MKTFGLTEDWKLKDFPKIYDGRIFFLTNPNAPLGFTFSQTYIEELAGRVSGTLVIDETYADFAEVTSLELVRKYDNVVVTRTFSKSYSLAGMRLGLAVARPEVISALDKIRDHYNLDRLAQAAAVAALHDQEYLRETVVKIQETRQWFCDQLGKLGYTVIPSHGNYVFATPPDRNGERVYQGLFDRKILVRHFPTRTWLTGCVFPSAPRRKWKKQLRHWWRSADKTTLSNSAAFFRCRNGGLSCKSNQIAPILLQKALSKPRRT